jgi:predicted ATPase
MILRFAVSGYRSLRDLAVELGQLTIVRGANGSGKSSLYRALRLIGDVAQGRLVASLAAEGGLPSAMWAGPEKFSREMRSGEYPIQGIVRSGPASLRLGFSGEDFGYAIDLGFPTPEAPFPLDPEIKVEAMWTGGTLGRTNIYAERRGPLVRLRRADTGEWRQLHGAMESFDSMVTYGADPIDGMELLLMRERMRGWRFYDSLRTDRDAPARRPAIMTYTPILASDGADLAAAVTTLQTIGDGRAFSDTIADAFPGSNVTVGDGIVQMRQAGLLRPLGAAELSDGTLRYLLLATALLTPRPPEIMILNEPEASLHPSLMAPLARLLIAAAARSQIVVVSHSDALVAALRGDAAVSELVLHKDLGETMIEDADRPRWEWPKR